MTKEQIAILRQTPDADLAGKELVDINLAPDLEKQIEKARADGKSALLTQHNALLSQHKEDRNALEAALKTASAQVEALTKEANEKLAALTKEANEKIAILTTSLGKERTDKETLQIKIKLAYDQLAETDGKAKREENEKLVLLKSLNEERTKRQSMEGHPDVVAARKEAARKNLEIATRTAQELGV